MKAAKPGTRQVPGSVSEGSGQDSTADATALNRLLTALAAHGSEVEEYENPKAGERYLAQCPAHEDGRPSLVIFDHDGRVRLHCRSGCEKRDVLAAVGLTMGDLFTEDYRYLDADGNVVRTVHRIYPDSEKGKDFRQSGDTKGAVTLYRLPEVIDAVDAGREVFLVEGEKDADTLAGVGVVATTSPMGAASVGKVDVSPLKGARVVLVPDEDAAGERWLAAVQDRLRGVAASVDVRRVAAGKDVTEHIEAGHGLDELVPSGPVRHPRTQAVLDATFDADELDSLPEPTSLISGLLNASEYVLLSGKFGTYKSFAALAWAFALATGKPWADLYAVPTAQPVVYVAAEGVSGIRKRLRALERRHGVKPAPGMLTVIARPVRLAIPEEVEGLRQVIEDKGAALTVLDTWHRMTPGTEENSATETAVPLDVALQLRDEFGVTVLVVHHTGHKQQHARGSSSLEDDADGSWMIRLGDGEDAEDRGPTTRRTLVHRKSKDGELVEDAVLRLEVDEDGGATVTVDPFMAPRQRRRGRPSRAEQREAATAELVDALDEAGVPAETGYRQVREWAGENGTPVTEAVAREAVKRRQEASAAGAVTAVPPKGRGTAPHHSEVCGDNAAENPFPPPPAETSSAAAAAETAGGVSTAVPSEGAVESISTAPAWRRTADSDLAPDDPANWQPDWPLCPKCGLDKHLPGGVLCGRVR